MAATALDTTWQHAAEGLDEVSLRALLAGEIPAVAVKVLNRHLRGFTRAELDALTGFLQRMLANSHG